MNQKDMISRTWNQVASWSALRKRLGLLANARGAASLEAAAARAASLTPSHLRALVRACAARYNNKRMDPGKLHLNVLARALTSADK